MPAHHDVRSSDVFTRRLHGTLAAAAERGPVDFPELLLTPGVGARTVQSLAMVAEVVHGAPYRFQDPARFSLAHGGKDRHPYPVPIKVYDETIRVLKSAVQKAKLGHTEELQALKRLDDQARGWSAPPTDRRSRPSSPASANAQPRSTGARCSAGKGISRPGAQADRPTDEDRDLQHQQRQQRFASLASWLEAAMPDVVCLQELKCEEGDRPGPPGQGFRGRRRRSGALLASRRWMFWGIIATLMPLGQSLPDDVQAVSRWCDNL